MRRDDVRRAERQEQAPGNTGRRPASTRRRCSAAGCPANQAGRPSSSASRCQERVLPSRARNIAAHARPATSATARPAPAAAPPSLAVTRTSGRARWSESRPGHLRVEVGQPQPIKLQSALVGHMPAVRRGPEPPAVVPVAGVASHLPHRQARRHPLDVDRAQRRDYRTVLGREVPHLGRQARSSAHIHPRRAATRTRQPQTARHLAATLTRKRHARCEPTTAVGTHPACRGCALPDLHPFALGEHVVSQQLVPFLGSRVSGGVRAPGSGVALGLHRRAVVCMQTRKDAGCALWSGQPAVTRSKVRRR